MKTLIAVILIMPALAFAQVNKCLDAKGKVVGYGSECPAGSRPEKMDIKPGPTPPQPASSQAAPAKGSSQQSIAERDADFRKRQIEKQEAAAKAEKSSAEAADRKRACTEAQAYLKNLQDKQRMSRTDPKTGERTFMQDSEYPGEIARTQRSISANCK